MDWIEIEPTSEDIDATAFRITRHADAEHDVDRFRLIMYCLIGDYVDGAIMLRAVKSCDSLREFEMQHDWLREEVQISAQNTPLKLIDDYLKIKLAF
jgi:hypothetical protein